MRPQSAPACTRSWPLLTRPEPRSSSASFARLPPAWTRTRNGHLQATVRQERSRAAAERARAEERHADKDLHDDRRRDLGRHVRDTEARSEVARHEHSASLAEDRAEAAEERGRSARARARGEEPDDESDTSGD